MYFQQRNTFSCAPIALLNLSNALGLKLSYKKYYQTLVQLCECDYDGTSRRSFDKIMKKTFKAIKLLKPSQKDIEDALIDNYVIMAVAWKSDNEIFKHVFLIYKMTNYYFFTINLENKFDKISKKKFIKQYMQSYLEPAYPAIWIVSKEINNLKI